MPGIDPEAVDGPVDFVKRLLQKVLAISGGDAKTGFATRVDEVQQILNEAKEAAQGRNSAKKVDIKPPGG